MKLIGQRESRQGNGSVMWNGGAMRHAPQPRPHSEPVVLISAGLPSAVPSQYHVSTSCKACYIEDLDTNPII